MLRVPFLDRTVGTLVNFLEALIISWVIVLGAYCIALLAMRSVWWTIRFASWAIPYATFGVTLVILRSIAWVIRWVARFNQGANNIQSHGGSAAAISHSAVGHEARGMPRLRPLFPDAAAFPVKEAREALFAYERRAFIARSEIRETVTRTLETIAQTKALMARIDAARQGVARSAP
jgi:hypothetical protein